MTMLAINWGNALMITGFGSLNKKSHPEKCDITFCLERKSEFEIGRSKIAQSTPHTDREV